MISGRRSSNTGLAARGVCRRLRVAEVSAGFGGPARDLDWSVITWNGRSWIRRDASANCGGSNQLDPPSVASAYTAPFTTPLTFNASSSPDQTPGIFGAEATAEWRNAVAARAHPRAGRSRVGRRPSARHPGTTRCGGRDNAHADAGEGSGPRCGARRQSRFWRRDGMDRCDRRQRLGCCLKLEQDIVYRRLVLKCDFGRSRWKVTARRKYGPAAIRLPIGQPCRLARSASDGLQPPTRHEPRSTPSAAHPCGCSS